MLQVMYGSVTVKNRTREIIYPQTLTCEEKINHKLLDQIKLSAKEGDEVAQCALGRMYERGSSGIEQSDYKALELYEKSAQQGFDHAQYDLGILLGKLQHKNKSLEWLEKAAFQNKHYTYSLGMLYLKGEGAVQVSECKAFELFNKAAQMGHKCAQYELGCLYLGFVNWIDEARKCFEKAARQGECRAQYRLGLMYFEGLGGLEASESKALNWFVKSANNGNLGAQAKLEALVGYPRSRYVMNF